MPEKTTAAACVRQICTDCGIEGELLCLHALADLADFGVLAVSWLITFLAGMIGGGHWLALAIWGGLAVLFFSYVEALVLCRHCPHYAKPGAILRCHANWGLLKIPPLDSRPLNRLERAIWILYGAILFLYYVPFCLLPPAAALGLHHLGAVAWVWTVWRTQCVRCYHLSCPANHVLGWVRQISLPYYPDFDPCQRRRTE